MVRCSLLALTLVSVACGGEGDDAFGMECADGPSLCGTLEGSISTPVTCNIAASEANGIGDPPTSTTVWDQGFNAIEGREVEGLPFAYALNDLDFWEGEEMYVAIICDTDGDSNFTESDAQGVYGGDTAVPVVVPSDGLVITL